MDLGEDRQCPGFGFYWARGGKTIAITSTMTDEFVVNEGFQILAFQVEISKLVVAAAAVVSVVFPLKLTN